MQRTPKLAIGVSALSLVVLMPLALMGVFDRSEATDPSAAVPAGANIDATARAESTTSTEGQDFSSALVGFFWGLVGALFMLLATLVLQLLLIVTVWVALPAGACWLAFTAMRRRQMYATDPLAIGVACLAGALPAVLIWIVAAAIW